MQDIYTARKDNTKNITLKVMQIFLRSIVPTKYFDNQTKLFTAPHIQMTSELGSKTKAWRIKGTWLPV